MTRSPISHAPMETPIGRLWISVSPRGLVAISRGEAPDPDLPGPAASDPDAAASALAELADYFAGRRRTFSLALDLEDVSRFDAAIWHAARGIPFGATASYGELAAMAGYPRAARAAGGSMSRCRVSPVVPCHRVIHADGSIGGWGSDTWVKHWLLDHERGASASSMP